MQLLISGKQVDVGDNLRGHVRDRLAGAVTKLFDRPIDGAVTFSKTAHLYRADCSVHVGSGLRAQAHGEAPDIYAAFESAAERLEKRLRRWKRRLKHHHNSNKVDASPVIAARSFTLSPEPEEGADDAPETAASDSAAMVIAESTTDILTLTVREAVMRLDLGDLPAMMFRNSAHGGLNVVYRRPDGHIGWIEPGPGAGSEPR